MRGIDSDKETTETMDPFEYSQKTKLEGEIPPSSSLKNSSSAPFSQSLLKKMASLGSSHPNAIKETKKSSLASASGLHSSLTRNNSFQSSNSQKGSRKSSCDSGNQKETKESKSKDAAGFKRVSYREAMKHIRTRNEAQEQSRTKPPLSNSFKYEKVPAKKEAMDFPMTHGNGAILDQTNSGKPSKNQSGDFKVLHSFKRTLNETRPVGPVDQRKESFYGDSLGSNELEIIKEISKKSSVEIQRSLLNEDRKEKENRLPSRKNSLKEFRESHKGKGKDGGKPSLKEQIDSVTNERRRSLSRKLNENQKGLPL